MTTMNTEMANTKTAERELSIDELDSASGGFIWILPVVGGFAVGTGIRMGIDWALKKLF
jgi:flavin-dependent dehydrogenase